MAALCALTALMTGCSFPLLPGEPVCGIPVVTPIINKSQLEQAIENGDVRVLSLEVLDGAMVREICTFWE